MDYGEDLNFWGSTYYFHNDQEVNSIPYSLDLKDLGNTELLGSGLKTHGSEERGKVLRVESLRYMYLVKKLMIQRLDLQSLNDAKNLDETDYLITQILKQNESLYMLADKTYGELINYRSFQQHNNHYEFYQIIENFQLWTNRYIQPEVSTCI